MDSNPGAFPEVLLSKQAFRIPYIPYSWMEKNMEDFVKKECGIIVTACRMKSDTYHKVIDYLGEDLDYDIIWYGHYVYQVLKQNTREC